MSDLFQVVKMLNFYRGQETNSLSPSILIQNWQKLKDVRAVCLLECWAVALGEVNDYKVKKPNGLSFGTTCS